MKRMEGAVERTARLGLLGISVLGSSLLGVEPQGLLAIPIPVEVAYEGTGTPSGYLFRLNEMAGPNWRELIGEAAPRPQTDRCSVAFGLGVALADTYICVETMDLQMVKNSGQEIQIFAQSLGLGHLCQEAWADHIRMAEENEWAMLRTQIDSTFEGIRSRLTMQHDVDLAKLVELGVWFRLYEAGCGAILRMDKVPVDPCALIPCGEMLKLLTQNISECQEMRKDCDLLGRLARILELSPNRVQTEAEITAGIAEFRNALQEELGRLKQG